MTARPGVAPAFGRARLLRFAGWEPAHRNNPANRNNLGRPVRGQAC
jgi:hypothetical protein